MRALVRPICIGAGGRFRVRMAGFVRQLPFPYRFLFCLFDRGLIPADAGSSRS